MELAGHVDNNDYQQSKYIENALAHLVPVLFRALTQQEEYEEEDDWLPSKAAALCMAMLSHCTEDIDSYLVPLVETHIQVSNYRYILGYFP